MEQALQQLAKLTDNELQLGPLGKKLRGFDFMRLLQDGQVPEQSSDKKYSRNILLLDPIEVVVLNWPPGVESAVHHHEGFWGYVFVVEGECENIEYEYEDGVLKEQVNVKGYPEAYITEKDGVIHKLRNPHPEKRAVTIHFYVPPLKSFDGMRIFDMENRRIGVLNDKAKTSSWEEPEEAFRDIENDAFRYLSYADQRKSSHHIVIVSPKPDQQKINRMLERYYNEQAHIYDHFDTTHPSRNAYNRTVNELIVEGFKEHKPAKVLSLACGTGRRANEVRRASGLDYSITGVDLSCEMVEQADDRGFNTHCADWLELDLGNQRFDAATYLYAFGHIASRSLRTKSLKKIHQHLNPGGVLFFDVFNLYDKNEWGPRALKFYEDHKLHEAGYERGDVFYKKAGGKEYAYLHYFDEDELKQVLEAAGFHVEYVKHIGYVHKAGEILNKSDEGALFVKAVKK